VTAGSDGAHPGPPGADSALRKATGWAPGSAVGSAAGRAWRRREVLGLAALAALPAACTRVERPGPGDTAGTPTGTPSGPPSTRPAAPTRPPGGGAVRPVPGKVILGAYLGLTGRSVAQSVALRRKQLGRDPRILHLFYAWRDNLPTEYPEAPPGCTVMVSWRGPSYDTINDGSADARIGRAARAFKRYGEPILLRWGWEMNGDWYLWGGARNDNDTAGFRSAWRRMHRIFREHGADNVSWVWSPNWNSSPDKAWNAYPRYYPGDEYVDWVGVSGYNLDRQSPDQLFGGIYADYGHRKPLMISEVGAVDRGGSTKADWIEQFAQWVTRHPAVAAVVWFDTDTHPDVMEKWRIDSDPAALAAYRAMARNPYFRG
jgi:hypothetical protein